MICKAIQCPLSFYPCMQYDLMVSKNLVVQRQKNPLFTCVDFINEHKWLVLCRIISLLLVDYPAPCGQVRWRKRAEQVLLLYKERTFIVQFPTSQMCVTRLRLSFDWFQWFRRGENIHPHACQSPVCTPDHLHTQTHTHTHSKIDSHTYVHSLDTYKNWNTNTNNTTIKTLYFFFF